MGLGSTSVYKLIVSISQSDENHSNDYNISTMITHLVGTTCKSWQRQMYRSQDMLS